MNEITPSQTIIRKEMNISGICPDEKEVKDKRSYIHGVVDICEEFGYEVDKVDGVDIHGRCLHCSCLIIGDDTHKDFEFDEEFVTILCETCNKNRNEYIDFIKANATSDQYKATIELECDNPDCGIPDYAIINAVGGGHIAIFPCGHEFYMDSYEDTRWDEHIVFEEDMCKCDVCKKVQEFVLKL